MSLVVGRPFPTDLSDRIRSLDKLLLAAAGDAIMLPAVANLHATVLRGRSVPTPLSRLRPVPAEIREAVAAIEKPIMQLSSPVIGPDGGIRAYTIEPGWPFDSTPKAEGLASLLSERFNIVVTAPPHVWLALGTLRFDALGEAQLREVEQILDSTCLPPTAVERADLLYFADLPLQSVEELERYEFSEHN